MKADANIKIRKRLPRVGPCRVSYKKPVITVEGNFKICDCRDVFGALEVGNVFNETIEQIWHGQKIKDLREKFFTPEMLPEVCQKCEVYDSIYK
jgi:radical SAM protein with 4Fe4S-binding SPASM domain